MEDSAGKRIKYIRRKLGITQEEVARKMDLTEQTVRRYEDKKELPAMYVMCFESLYGINRRWINEGVGEAYLPPPISAPEQELFKFLTELDKEGLSLKEALMEYMEFRNGWKTTKKAKYAQTLDIKKKKSKT